MFLSKLPQFLVWIRLQCVLHNTYTYSHEKWKNGHLVVPVSSCQFRKESLLRFEVTIFTLYTYKNDTLIFVTEGLVPIKLPFVTQNTQVDISEMKIVT